MTTCAHDSERYPPGTRKRRLKTVSKIQVQDPTPEDFRVAFHKIAGELSVQCDDDVVTYLIKRHYEPQQRPMRFCHPRDLLRQVIDYCSIHQQTPVLTTEAIDAAVENYFCGW